MNKCTTLGKHKYLMMDEVSLKFSGEAIAEVFHVVIQVNFLIEK